MTAKEYLKQVGRMNKEIENKAEEIQKLKDMATRITSSTDKERVQSNSSQDKLGDAVAEIIDLENELQEIVTRNLDKRKYITKQIDELDNDIYYDVLYKRYILCKEFHEIATELRYTMDNVFKIHRRAVRSFEKKHGHNF